MDDIENTYLITAVRMIVIIQTMIERSLKKTVNVETEHGPKLQIGLENITVISVTEIVKIEKMNGDSDIAILLYIFTMERILRIPQQIIQLKSC
mgnify:CR=1 FL=1